MKIFNAGLKDLPQLILKTQQSIKYYAQIPQLL